VRILLGCLLVALLAPVAGAELSLEEEEAILRKARGFEDNLIRVARRIRPITVAIENWRSPAKGLPVMRAGAGSGVVVSTKGFILTNQHVIQGAKRLVVVLSDGRRLPAQVLGADERGDIALLQVEAREVRKLRPAYRKVNTDKLVEGAWVLAVGNPFFTAQEGRPIVTLGVLSGLGRVCGGEFMYGDAIQHDAEVNPGNSGGPLFDLNGDLLGINGRISTGTIFAPSNSGVAYAIPMQQVRRFLGPMIDGEKKQKHGDELIALKVSTTRDGKGEECGVRVDKILKGCPLADRRGGGILVGDVIYKVSIRGKSEKIFNMTHYMNALSTLPEGSKISIYALRGRRRISFRNIVLGAEK
jgi:serine protease Do